MTASRRGFIQAIAAAATITGLNPPRAAGETSSQDHHEQAGVPPSYFDVNAAYTTEELTWLYKRKRLHAGSKFFDVQIAPPTVSDSVLFYWDNTKLKLTNPHNVVPDPSIASGNQYGIQADVLNFHPSSAQVTAIWSKLDTNLQLTLRTYAVDSDGNLLTSITMAGISVAQQFLGGSDGKLLSIPADSGQNQLTSFPPAEQITISNGQIDIMVGLAGQKKASFWDHLVTIVKAITNSPVFGLLPIPKLYETAANTVTTLLGQVEQSNRLVQILNGKKLYFRICDGSCKDDLHLFVIRPGFWVIMDAQAAGAKINPTTHDIDDWVLDIEDEMYELKDKNNKAVDITYSVASILLPEIKKAT